MYQLLDLIRFDTALIIHLFMLPQTADAQAELSALTHIVPKLHFTLPVSHFIQLQKCGTTDVSLYQQKWEKYATCIREVQEWGAEKLWIWVSNSNPTILMEISHITFRNLILLSASDNNIESIEILQSIDMPHIQTLLLDKNKITTVRSLRKLRNPVEHLDLSINHLTSLSALWTPSYMKKLQLEYFCGKDKVVCDCRCLLKLQPIRFQMMTLPMHLREYNLKALSLLGKNKTNQKKKL